MTVDSAKQDVKVSFGQDFVIIGGDRVEVSPDGKKVTAYTNEGVETKAASGAAAQGISISADFNTVVLNGATIERAADGHLVISSSGTVITKPDPANDTAAKAPTHDIGAIESAGEHKGEIYGGIYPADNKPIWFSMAPSLMDHYAAAAWARGQGGSLPSKKQGKYLMTLKPLNESAEVLKGNLEIGPAKPDGGGAFREIFNRGGSFPAGYVWLAEPRIFAGGYAWSQRLSDGVQNDIVYRTNKLPVLCVRR